MFLFYFSISLTILSNVFYHIAQKLTPGGVNPFFSLAVTYLVAAVVCLALLAFNPLKTSLLDSLRSLNWASYALAFAIVGLEVGFLLAYRAGWNISLAGLVSNAVVSILLVPVGLLLFREKLSAVNVIGIGVCVLGLVLVNVK